MKTYIDNDNFIHMMKAMNSEHFGRPEYTILFDRLNKENKKILEDINIPKNGLIILTKDPKKVPSKFKHQIQVEKLFEKDDIFKTLKMVFKSGNRKQVKQELNKFENRHILTILESTSIYYPKLAMKLNEMEKYVYSNYFHDMILYELEGMGYLPRWVKRS